MPKLLKQNLNTREEFLQYLEDFNNHYPKWSRYWTMVFTLNDGSEVKTFVGNEETLLVTGMPFHVHRVNKNFSMWDFQWDAPVIDSIYQILNTMEDKSIYGSVKSIRIVDDCRSLDKTYQWFFRNIHAYFKKNSFYFDDMLFVPTPKGAVHTRTSCKFGNIHNHDRVKFPDLYLDIVRRKGDFLSGDEATQAFERLATLNSF